MLTSFLRSLHHIDFILIITLIMIYQQDSDAMKIVSHSFEAPFKSIDNSGLRMVSSGWRTSGTAVINTNFVRLTPDQQSKKGALWSREPLDVPSFSSILKFRISGKGKDFYGDGIALWVVQQGFYSEGEVHGFQEQFIGVGIVFDTFRNTENLNAHRDVTVLINDGEKTWGMMTTDVQGCNMLGLRYYGDRADFKVTDSSQAKIIINDKNLTIQIDPRGEGDWLDCVSLTDVGLPSGWAKSAYLGLTAATGQLSDNHDVISLQTYADQEVMEQALSDKMGLNNTVFESEPPGMSKQDRLERLEISLNRFANRLEFVDHHYEHYFATVGDNIDDIKIKLDLKELEAEERLAQLEKLVKQEVDKSIKSKLNVLESDAHTKMDKKIENFETDLDEKSLNNLKNNGNWKLPFILLFFLMVGSGIGIYFFYQRVVRKQFL